MKITAIELGMLRVPLKTPFKTALRTVETVEDVVVLIRTDTGNTGYGEAPATAVITAVLFTLAPARRAAMLDPVQALSRR